MTKFSIYLLAFGLIFGNICHSNIQEVIDNINNNKLYAALIDNDNKPLSSDEFDSLLESMKNSASFYNFGLKNHLVTEARLQKIIEAGFHFITAGNTDDDCYFQFSKIEQSEWFRALLQKLATQRQVDIVIKKENQDEIQFIAVLLGFGHFKNLQVVQFPEDILSPEQEAIIKNSFYARKSNLFIRKLSLCQIL